MSQAIASTGIGSPSFFVIILRLLFAFKDIVIEEKD